MRWLWLFFALPSCAQGIIAPLAFVPQAGAPSVTTLVSAASAGSTETSSVGTQSYSGCATDTYCMAAIDPVLSGNLMLGFYEASAAITSATTDKSDSFTCLTAVHEATTGRYGSYCYIANVTDSSLEFNGKWASGTTHVQERIFEYYNAAASSPVDVSNSHAVTTATTSMTAGSITPNSGGETILATFCRTSNPGGNASAGGAGTFGTFTAGSSGSGVSAWTLILPDTADGCATEYGVQSTAQAINPAMTSSISSDYIGYVVALKAASAGTAPTGRYVCLRQSEDTPNGTAVTGSLTYQFPTPCGDLAVMDWNGATDAQSAGNNYYPSSITDSVNTWQATSALIGLVSTSEPNAINYYSCGAASPTCGGIAANTGSSITVNTPSSTTGNGTTMFYAIAGASTSAPFVQNANGGCDQSSTTSPADLLVSSSPSCPTNVPISPSVSAGVTICTGGQYNNTSVSMSSPSSAVFDGTTFGGQSLSGPSTPNENNFYGHYYFSTNASQAWAANQVETAGQAFGQNAASCDIFK